MAAPLTTGALSLPTFQIPFSALRRFFVRLIVFTLLLGVPAAAVTFVASGRADTVYAAEATLLAPRTSAPVDLPEAAPLVSGPLMPAAYGPVLESAAVLADALRRLAGEGAPEPTMSEVAAFSQAVSFGFDERSRSTLITVGVEGASASQAVARANAVSEALVAWDDARARAEANRVVAALEAQLEALEAQLEQLRFSGSRANLPQIAGVSVLTATLRQDIAVARADAVGSRGNLEFLASASRGSQVEPSPVIDAVIVFVLVAVMVIAVQLVVAGSDRRVQDVSGLSDVTGLPLLADLTSLPAKVVPGQRDLRELSFLKAHVDRNLRAGGEVLVAGLRDDRAAARVASALDDLYSAPGALTRVTAGPPLLASGDALVRAAKADAVVLVAAARATDRLELSRVVSLLGRSPANVLGVVAVPGARKRGAAGR